MDTCSNHFHTRPSFLRGSFFYLYLKGPPIGHPEPDQLNLKGPPTGGTETYPQVWGKIPCTGLVSGYEIFSKQPSPRSLKLSTTYPHLFSLLPAVVVRVIIYPILRGFLDPYLDVLIPTYTYTPPT